MKKTFLFFTILFMSGLIFGQQDDGYRRDVLIPSSDKNNVNEIPDGNFKAPNSTAALPQYYNFNTNGQNNTFPLGEPNGKKVEFLYLPGDFNQPSPAPAGNITSISIRISTEYTVPGTNVFSDLSINLGQASITALPLGSFYQGPMTNVYYSASVSLTAVAGDWLTIQLDTPFYYDPSQSLIVGIEHCGYTGSANFVGGTTTGSGMRRSWSSGGCPFNYSSTNGWVNHLGFNMGGAPSVPISNWPIYVGILAMGTFLVIRFKSRLFA